MPKMTKKGREFVGGEISKLVHKGPSSGPQKGKKYTPKRAVAAALSMAQRKGFKGAARKEAVMYRDPEYGALMFIQEGDGFITYDHNSVDAPAVLAVLEQSMRPSRRDDGGIRWSPGRTHPTAVEANVRRAAQVLGYVEDHLAERAILTVTRAEAVTPDLPSGDRFLMVHESLESGLRRIVEVAIAALQDHGPVTPPTFRFHGRPNARDTFGRPLPFLTARAFAQPDNVMAAEDALREALQPFAEHLVRASIKESGDSHATVEVAVAPTVSICEAYMDTTIPVFEAQNLSGARTVWLSLESPLGLAEAADIAQLAAMSTGAVGLRTERDGRAVVAHIPSSHDGNYVGDHAFHERLSWLMGLLDPWNPDVKDIGEQTTVMAGAPSQRDGLTEADGVMPLPVPSQLDAKTIRDLELHLSNTGRLYAQKLVIEKSQAKRLKAGTFRRDIAAKQWMYWVDAGAKDFVQEYGGNWQATFPLKEREFLAMQYAAHTERRYKDGDLKAESMTEATRKQVGASVLGPEKFRLNVARIGGAEARDYAEKLYSEADDANLEQDLPDLDKNFAFLKSKMRYAKNLTREEMPVIDPKDIFKFGQRLQKGYIDIFKPYADVAQVYPDVAVQEPDLGHGQFPKWPQMRGGSKGRVWVTLGQLDKSQTDDVVPAKITMVPVKDLKPLQNEIWYDKLIATILAFGPPMEGGHVLTNAVIIVSKEGYILDGHHRFGQAMLRDPSLKIKALVVPLGIDELLKIGLSYGAALGNEPRESVESMREANGGAFSPTPGLVRAAFKVPGSARQCGECGLGMPKYPGRYPNKCPRCAGEVCDSEELGERTKKKYKKRSGVSAAQHKKEALKAAIRRKKLTSAEKAAIAKKRKIRGESVFEADAARKPFIKQRGDGKDVDPALPKGTIVQVGKPESPKDASGEECELDKLKARLKAAQDKYKEAQKASAPAGD